uniref:NACHT domain-containing protein n=1 Tax=Oncorhynchus tshawytscha TaxID=74940 RepID=A0AAZ3Q188_ONCTS
SSLSLSSLSLSSPCPSVLPVSLSPCLSVLSLSLCPLPVPLSPCLSVLSLSLCPLPVSLSSPCLSVLSRSLCPLTVSLSLCPLPVPLSSHCLPVSLSSPYQVEQIVGTFFKRQLYLSLQPMTLSQQEMEAGLSLASHYVDVRLVQRQILIGSGKNTSKCLEKDLVVIGDAERRRGSLARSQVFESSPGAKPKRSIVLLGNAGMGKSTLIKKLCVDWSDGLLPQFDFVFLLDGKALTLPPEPTYSLRSLLLHLSCPHPRDVFNQVLSVPERVLVLFDGFEVVRDLEGLLQSPADDSKGENYSVRQLFSGLLQRKLLPGCSLLLSARPRGTVSGLLRRADSLLELSGFSPPDIERYLGQYFSGQSLELHSQPYLLSVCWNPALCHMVCLLLEHWDVSEPLPSTLTGLCYRVEEEREEENRCVLSELSGLAWQGVKGHSSLLTLTLDNTVYVKLRLFGLRTGLVHSHCLRGEQGRDGDGGGVSSDNILSWAHPFLQSFLGGAHLSVSSCVSDRALLAQILPQPRGRRRPQGECLDLAQRFAVGLLFRNNAELRDLRAAVISHLENLHHGDLSPARLLEACHCVYETGDIRLVRHLVRNLPEVLSFQGVPLCPADAFVVWNLLDQCRTLRRRFCLGLEDTGLRMTGLKLLTGLNNIHSYRYWACIADTITLWEELEQSGEEELLKAVVSKLTLNPFRATQVSHVQHLSTLVNIHTSRRLSESPAQSTSPGVSSALLMDHGTTAFTLLRCRSNLSVSLISLSPSPSLENSKLGDSGAEGLAGAVLSLSSLQIINLYSNVISDGGAESLAAVLPQMTSLSDLDVKYNSFTALGAQSLASSLRDCPWIKSLG